MTESNAPITLWQKLRFRNWHIFTKFVVVLLVVAVVPLLFVTFFGGREASIALTEQENISISRLANSTAKRIEQLLSDNHNIITMLANDQSVITYISHDRVDETSVDDQLNVNYTILNARDSNDTIELVSVFDSEGWVIAHTKDYIVGTHWDFREYFQEAINGKKYLSGVLIGTKDDTPGVFGSAPVYSKDRDEIIGVLSTKIRGTYITDILASTLLTAEGAFSEGEVYLLNEYGIVMSHSDPNSDLLYHSFGTVSDVDLEDILDVKMLGGDCPANDPDCEVADKIAREPKPLVALQALGDMLVGEMDTGGVGHFRYCRPSDLNTTLPASASKCLGDWHSIGYATVVNPVSETGDGILMVVVDIPEEVFLGEINSFVKQAQFATIGLSIFVIMVALIVARTLAKPIGILSKAAQSVENHDSFEPEDIVEVTVLGDEIGQLARVFSSMVLSLRARMAELRTIYEIGNKISDSVELSDTLSDVVDSLGDVINFDAVEICLYNTKKKTLELYLTNTEVMSDDETVEKVVYEVENDYFSPLLESRHGLLVDNIDTYPEYALVVDRSWDAFKPKSYLGVSLWHRGNVVGTIEMISSKVDGFSEDNKRILESVSIQAAVAISNAREVKDRERRLVNMEIVIDDSQVDEVIESVTNREFFKSLKSKS